MKIKKTLGNNSIRAKYLRNVANNIKVPILRAPFKVHHQRYSQLLKYAGHGSPRMQ